MPLWIAVVVFLLLASATANAVYYSILLARVLIGRRRVPTLSAVLDRVDARRTEAPPPARSTPAVPSIAVVVPAHNERRSIARLAASLRDHDYAPMRVVFALDRCTDGTERALLDTVGDDPRFEILTIDRCPDDWAGKVHAMHTAVTAADAPRDADMLLFADADTWLERGALRAAVAHLRDEALDLLSLLPTLTADDPWERHTQPACGLELVRQYPLDLVNREEKRRAFANGQFMLFTRAAYNAIGGHAPFRNELLEDIAIAREMVDRRGMRVGCLVADGVVRCKMYETADHFRRGWKRIFTEAARRNPARLRKHARRVLLSGVGIPGDTVTLLVLAAVLAPLYPRDPLPFIAIAFAACSLAVFLVAIGTVYRAQHVPLRHTLTYPLAAWRTASILHAAADDLDRGVPTQWAGRSYRRDARGVPPRRRTGATPTAR